MATLKYIGTPAQWDIQAGSGNDPVTLSTLNLLLSQNMTMPQVTTQINTLLQPYAPASYATSAMASLATPAYLNAQVATYVPTTAINQANGPVGLGAASGRVDPGQINAPSTQQWPSPFWSPASYQSAAVTATTAPVQLYTMAMPYPGYTYVLVCLGMIDASVAADDGTYPQVLVRVGSPTGLIAALGYGIAESYTGPAPGSVSSQAFINSAFPAPGTWTTITNWFAQNTGGFTSTLVGGFLQVQITETATISASITFSGSVAGSKATVSTAIQIIDNAGNVIQTGATVTGDGTATVSWTGNIVAGQLYGIQVAETGDSTAASITSGLFTISSNMVGSSGPCNIMPVPVEYQTSLTDATTLYVMLQSSNSSTAVTASTFDPGLWVMPVPWASQQGVVIPVTFDSVGTPFTATTSPLTSSFTATSGADVFVAVIAQNSGSTPTLSVAYGGVSMTQVGVVNMDNTSTLGTLAIFRAAGAGSGTSKAISVSTGGGFYAAACAFSYINVQSVSSAQTVFGNSASVSQSVTYTSGIILCVLANQGFASMGTPTGGNNRAFQSGVAGLGESLAIRDATSTTTFAASLSTTDNWGGVAIILNS